MAKKGRQTEGGRREGMKERRETSLVATDSRKRMRNWKPLSSWLVDI